MKEQEPSSGVVETVPQVTTVSESWLPGEMSQLPELASVLTEDSPEDHRFYREVHGQDEHTTAVTASAYNTETSSKERLSASSTAEYWW